MTLVVEKFSAVFCFVTKTVGVSGTPVWNDEGGTSEMWKENKQFRVHTCTKVGHWIFRRNKKYHTQINMAKVKQKH